MSYSIYDFASESESDVEPDLAPGQLTSLDKSGKATLTRLKVTSQQKKGIMIASKVPLPTGYAIYGGPLLPAKIKRNSIHSIKNSNLGPAIKVVASGSSGTLPPKKPLLSMSKTKEQMRRCSKKSAMPKMKNTKDIHCNPNKNHSNHSKTIFSLPQLIKDVELDQESLKALENGEEFIIGPAGPLSGMGRKLRSQMDRLHKITHGAKPKNMRKEAGELGPSAKWKFSTHEVDVVVAEMDVVKVRYFPS